MTYRDYLQLFIASDSLIGDLARDAFREPAWKGTTARGLRVHIARRSRNPHPGAIKAWKISKIAYEHTKQLLDNN
ncbi:hypothetical protein F7734_56175 [Scytonema sp. UIC 10036]|uniref:hypothetical protein n=1 Tax=Scytonema sp. UIC 10036 TaxID=2304196 RepID=UPI0012DA984D|nr:hypothetical protein [Scytonema sp. UIC 10036]MUH01115.1 hypothetical protein [Scytonema sp. UIC 10036]